MICRKAWFEPVRTFNVANTYPLEYWLRMSPLPGKAVLLKAANFAGVSRLPFTPILAAGNLGLIAKRPESKKMATFCCDSPSQVVHHLL